MADRMLVVDDEEYITSLVQELLRSRLGWRVERVHEGRLAIQRMEAARFDLVITDLRMPLVTGMTVVYSINRMFPAVPVVVLTAFGTTELRDICLHEGAAAFLEKTMDTPQLLTALERVLDSQPARELALNQTRN